MRVRALARAPLRAGMQGHPRVHRRTGRKGHHGGLDRYNPPMARIGTVIAIHGDHASVEASRRGICDGCSDHSSCTAEGVSTTGASEAVTARNPIHARPGDHVEFELPGHTELKISFVVWVVPLIGLVAGAVMGANFHHLVPIGRDAATLIGLLLGAGLAFGVVMAIDRRARGDDNLVPEIVKVLPPDSCSLPSHVADPSSVSSLGTGSGGHSLARPRPCRGSADPVHRRRSSRSSRSACSGPPRPSSSRR